MSIARRIVLFAVLVGAHGVPAQADVQPRGKLRGVVIDKETEHPVAGATAILTPSAPAPAVIVATTDAEGRFVFEHLPPTTYNVLVVYGEARVSLSNIEVGVDETLELRPRLPLGAEVISIQEARPIAVSMPKPVASTVKRLLPWTDDAIKSNAWGVGWMLLDVDKQGVVSGFRFLHRPERGLDKVAENQVWKLRFEPARDAGGQPVEAQILWKMEWPAYWWYEARFKELGAMIPVGPAAFGYEAARRSFSERGSGAGFLTADSKYQPQMPPCKGSGPLNLDLLGDPTKGRAGDTNGGPKLVYRDCSPPDLERAASEARISRPGGAR